MADAYDSLAKRFGFPPSALASWRQAAGAPPPAVPVASYEGATLQQFMPQASAPPSPAPAAPASPPPSYEGATLQGMVPPTPGVRLADPPRAARGVVDQQKAPPRPRVPLATGDNVAPASTPAQLSPKVMAEVQKVADASDATKRNVKTAIDADERKKNLEGATFYEPPQTSSATGTAVGAVGPIVVDKGGRRPKSWQVHEGLDLGPDAERAAERASERGYMANDLDYAAGRKAAEFERGYLEQHHRAAEKFAAEETARAEKYQQQTDEHMAKLDELRAQIREAKVDPLAGMRNGASQFLSMVAVALGAFASRSGENQGMNALRHTISMNLARQEKELERLERGARGEMNFLAALKQTYGDQKVAREAAYIAYLERAKTELAKNLGDPSVADPRMLAAYERLNAQLDDELVNRTAKFRALTQDRVIRHDVNAQPRYVGVGGPSVSKKAESDARYLAEAYEKAGIPAAISLLKDVDRVIDALGDGEIEGVGPIAGLIPNALLSSRGVAGRQAVQAIKNAIGHSLFGGALSPAEAEKLNTQLDGAKDAASLRRTVQAFRQALQHRAANIAAGASPEGVDLYEQRGGSVQRGAPSRRQIAPDKPTTPTIREAK